MITFPTYIRYWLKQEFELRLWLWWIVSKNGNLKWLTIGVSSVHVLIDNPPQNYALLEYEMNFNDGNAPGNAHPSSFQHASKIQAWHDDIIFTVGLV